MTRTRKAGVAMLIVVAAFAGCSKQSGGGDQKPGATPTPKPTPTPTPAPAGSVVGMGRTVFGDNGNTITVYSWKIGAKRSIPNGPHQVYETVDAGFCAGPMTEQSASDLATLFSLELAGGNEVVPDSQSEAGEFRTKGTVHPNACVRAPIVYQVGGGARPKYVVFSGTKTSKWIVP